MRTKVYPSLRVNTVKKWQKQCAGKDLLGFQLCDRNTGHLDLESEQDSQRLGLRVLQSRRDWSCCMSACCAVERSQAREWSCSEEVFIKCLPCARAFVSCEGLKDE